MSCKGQKYIGISDLLLEGSGFPMNIGSYEEGNTRMRVPGDPAEVGNTVLVKSSKKIEILVKVESIFPGGVRGQIINVLGDEHQGLSVDAKVEILNEYVSCVYSG